MDVSNENHLRRAIDTALSLEKELYSMNGLLEFVYLGMRDLYHDENCFEVSAVHVLQRYIQTILGDDVEKLKYHLGQLNEMPKTE